MERPLPDGGETEEDTALAVTCRYHLFTGLIRNECDHEALQQRFLLKFMCS